MESTKKLVGKTSRVRSDADDAARFEGEGGRLAGEPEIRHFSDEAWRDLPRHESHGHDVPAHWSEYVVDPMGVDLAPEDEAPARDASWAARIADAAEHR